MKQAIIALGLTLVASTEAKTFLNAKKAKCDDSCNVEFGDDFGCNDKCGDDMANYLPDVQYNHASTVDAGCDHSVGTYNANQGIASSHSDYVNKAIANAQSNTNSYAVGFNSVANTNSNTQSVAAANGNNGCATTPVVSTPIINRPVVSQPIYQAPVVVQQQAPVVQQGVAATVGNVAVNNQSNQLTASNNGNVQALTAQAAEYANQASQAANNNYANQAQYSNAANTNNAAANTANLDQITECDRVNHDATLKYADCGHHNANSDKDHVAHAADESLHKEEHCADEQKFCSEDHGKVNTVECTHICEHVTKHCDDGETAARQIWTKKKSCAAKCNDKRAVARNLHKATHKKCERGAFKLAKENKGLRVHKDVNQDAKSCENKLEDKSTYKADSAASSNNNAASSNNAQSNVAQSAASSANSKNRAASSNNQAINQNANNQVNVNNNRYTTSPVDTC